MQYLQYFIQRPASDVATVKIDFEDCWVHLRRPNTEPIVRIYTEAATAKEANDLAERFGLSSGWWSRCKRRYQRQSVKGYSWSSVQPTPVSLHPFRTRLHISEGTFGKAEAKLPVEIGDA